MIHKDKNILVVIPARGGSRGIPRKNLRALAGKPLIYYSIKTASASRYRLDLYVSSDDGEIRSIAQQIGSSVIERDSRISGDATTLDPVVYDALLQAEEREAKRYDIVVTLQPTSPLLKTLSLDAALYRMLEDDSLDSIIAAKENTHLGWKREEGRYLPNYKARLNRQYLDPLFMETGGFLITRREYVTQRSRIGEKVDLFLLEGGEAIDIDTYEDWHLCEYYLKRKRILFVVSGYREIGLGHVYNTLLIANDILNHSVEFLVDGKSDLAYEKIAGNHYTVHRQQCNDILEDIEKLEPDLVINDRLDTTLEYMRELKKFIGKIINFEDRGEGSVEADLLINAIYSEENAPSHHFYGYRYFLLRDEFLLAPPRALSERVERVLITFGGVDRHNYTCRVIDAIEEYCAARGIAIVVVAGFGYAHYESLRHFRGVEIYRDANNISEHMREADIVFTSAGRTTYEIAHLQVPAIVLAQNEREMTHSYATERYGFDNLGPGYEVSESEIARSLEKLVESPMVRRRRRERMAQLDMTQGRREVVRLINQTMEQL